MICSSRLILAMLLISIGMTCSVRLPPINIQTTTNAPQTTTTKQTPQTQSYSYVGSASGGGSSDRFNTICQNGDIFKYSNDMSEQVSCSSDLRDESASSAAELSVMSQDIATVLSEVERLKQKLSNIYNFVSSEVSDLDLHDSSPVSTTQAPKACLDGGILNSGTETCYYIVHKPLTWSAAEQFCLSDFNGAELLSLETEDEFTYVVDLIKNHDTHKAVYSWWTSGTYQNGEWIWKKGSGPVKINDGFVKWFPGQPNNDHSSANCIHLNDAIYWFTYYWGDGRCDADGINSVICEAPAV